MRKAPKQSKECSHKVEIMSDEQIGKHKGAVETLLHEKKELSRLLQIVNGQLKRHLTALEENGIDAEEFMEKLQEQGKQRQQQQQQESRRNRESGGQQNRQQSSSQEDEEFDLGGHLE